MKYSWRWILDNINPIPVWNGFETFEFSLRQMSVSSAIKTLFTCWDWTPKRLDRPTFFEMAEKMHAGEWNFPGQDSKAKVNNFIKQFQNGDVSVIAIKWNYLKSIGPQAFPNIRTNSEEEYVVIDGNHRLMALALRSLEENMDDKIFIKVFACETP